MMKSSQPYGIQEEKTDQEESTACTKPTTQERSWYLGRNQKSRMAGYIE